MLSQKLKMNLIQVIRKMMVIRTSLKNFIYLFIGFVTIFFFLSRRLLNRLPQKIDFTQENFPIYGYLFLCVNSIIIAIFLLYLIFFKQEESEKPKGLLFSKMQKFSLYLTTTLVESYKAVYFGIIQYIPNINTLLYGLCKIFRKIYPWLNYVYIICKILPRGVVGFCLILDIYLGEFNYFYSSGIILILPMIFNTLIFMIYDFAYNSIIQLNDLFLDHTWKDTGEKILINYRPKDETMSPIDFQNYAKIHNTCIIVEQRIRVFRDSNIVKKLPVVTLILTVIMGLCWGYICYNYFLLNNFFI